MNSIIEEIKVLSASDNLISNGSFEELDASTELMTNGDFSSWDYESGTITGFDDAGGDEVNCTSAGHGLITGNQIEIIGNANYNGAYEVTFVNVNVFKITHAYFTGTAGFVQTTSQTFDDTPDDWDVSNGVDTDNYHVRPNSMSEGIKIIGDDTSAPYLYQADVLVDVTDGSSISYEVNIESVTDGGIVIKNGTDEIVTITESGIHSGSFSKSHDDIRIYVYDDGNSNEIIINSISMQKNKLFKDWDNFNSGGGQIEEAIGYVGDRSARVYNRSDVNGVPSISQTITDSDILDVISGKKVIVGFAAKITNTNSPFNIFTYINGSSSVNKLVYVKHTDWEYQYVQIDVPDRSITSFTIEFMAPTTSNRSLYLDDVKLYYINEEELEKEIIVDKDNIKLSIEDDLFTFTADDISMKLRNVANPDFMNPMNFITENKLYAIIIKYNSGTISSPSYQYQYLFTNWDNCSRDETNDSDYINLSFFELSGLLSDMNWYLGRYIYDPEASDTGVYNFGTEKPLILDRNSSLNVAGETEDILNDRLLPALKNVVVQNKLPIYPGNINVEVDDNLLSDIGWVNNIDLIDADLSGKHRLLDYFIDTETNRLFILTIDNSYDDGENTEGDIVYVYEIVNGSYLKYIDEMALEGDISPFLDVSFVHRWDSYPSVIGSTIIVLQNSIIAGYQSSRIMEFKYNSDGTVVKTAYLSSSKHTDSTLESWGKAYINSSGSLVDGGTIVNSNWLDSNSLFTLLGDENIYTITNTESTSDDWGGEERYMTWGGNIDFNINKFPKYLQLSGNASFPDSTLANIMKEICVTQDALWYFKYNSSNGITLYIRRRSTNGEQPEEIDDHTIESDIKTISTKLSTITFDDITSSIYSNDPYRIKVFREWYNSKYGGGKQLKTLTMWDIQDLVLGDVKTFISNHFVEFMIKYLEFDRKKSETKVEFFELGEDV